MILPPAASLVSSLVDGRIERLFDGEVSRWSAAGSDLVQPLEVLRSYVLAGGKRLRPAFCYWSFVGAGGVATDPKVIDAAAALEMLHTSALVHDDIIDGSDRRHGEDTVHVRFADRHRRAAWKGESDRFGEGMAILVGDLALVYSSRLMAGAPPEALATFEEMRLEVNMGQYLDVLAAAQGLGPGPDAAAARSGLIMRYKTAKYTVERPLHIGAMLAAPERSAELVEPLSRFGLPLGEAFQLRDDLLGVFGDPAVTGKPVGDDLREGKATLLVALAAQRDPRGDTGLVNLRFGQADLTEGEIAGLQELITSTGARAEVEAAIAGLLDRSEAALAELPFTMAAVAALADLAAFVVGRDH